MWASLVLAVLAVGLWSRVLVRRSGALLAALCVTIEFALLVAYAAIDRLTGSGIDASVVYHLQTGLDGAGIGAFSGLAVATGAGLLAAVGAGFVTFRLIRATPLAGYAMPRLLGGVALLAGALAVNPAVGDLRRLLESGLSQSAAELGPVPAGFVPVESAAFAGTPRNFVLLYLESVERSYLDETRFPGLMPNLRALEGEAVSFTDLTEVEEAGWTIAGMVASQCGMPLIGSGAGFDRFLPGATCLGDLLDAEGYDLAYVGGADLGFAGKGTFYDSHHFDLVEGRTQLEPRLADPAYVNEWGLFDDSLYPQAIQRFDALAKGDAPFGLVMLTLDTHHPFGFPSQSCADQPYGDGTNQFLNAVHCADRLAAEFIRHIRLDPAFKDTVLVVASDHLAMPNLAEDLLNAGPRRNLLMVFAPDLPPALIGKPGTTLDLGPTLLSLIGSPTPALGFGRDLLADAPSLRAAEPGLEERIAAGRGYLAAMWSFPKITGGIAVDQAAGEVILDSRRLKYPLLLRLDDGLEVTGIDFDLNSDLTLAEIVATLPLDQKFLWLDACKKTEIYAAGPAPEGAELCALVGSLASPDLRQLALSEGAPLSAETLSAPFQHGTGDLAFQDTLLDELTRRRQFATSNIVSYSPPNGLTGSIAIRSAGYMNGESWALNPETGEKVNLMRGLTLLGLNPDATPVKLGHVDTCGYGGRQPDSVPLVTNFQTDIDAHALGFGAFAIVAHNSVVCYEVDPGLEPLFAGTRLTKWRDLWYEEPYVALIAGNGEVQEFVSERQSALGVDLTNIMRPLRRDAQRQLAWLPRIAHAGGALGDQTYTNSLEALEANATSFDLIEIDLSWTSDSQLVCLHDWDAPFLAVDGVAPAGPLPLADVMSRAATNAGFTPCTLETLTAWMRDHPKVRIVLDLKTGALDAYDWIGRTYPDLRPRFVPQVYQPEEYRPVRDMGFPDVIWSLYQYQGDADAVLKALDRMDVLGLAMPPERLDAGLARRARDATGVLSWVHTLNTEAELADALQAGAAEIFTDGLKPGPVARFEATSSGYESGESSLRGAAGDPLPLGRGLNLIALLPGRPPALLAAFDGCAALDTGMPPDPQPFHAALVQALSEGTALALVVHDSALCDGTALDPLFAGTPLTKAPAIGFRQPYIGLVQPDGRVVEFTGPEGTQLRQSLTVGVTP